MTQISTQQINQCHLIQNEMSLNSFKENLSRLTSQGDSLLFLNDGLFMLIKKDFKNDEFKQLTHHLSLNAIDEQIESRAISKLMGSINEINFSEFVALTQNCKKVISW